MAEISETVSELGKVISIMTRNKLLLIRLKLRNKKNKNKNKNAPSSRIR